MAGSATARVRVDMHLHTAGSYDCLSDPEEVLRVALDRGLQWICVTDHNDIAISLELKRRYPAHVIVGEEVRTAEGVDIIGLFLSERIEKGTPARVACEQIRAQGGLVYVPHPFVGGKGGGGRILASIADMVDVVEGFNARIHLQRLNDRAVAWAREHGVAVGAGSDAHTLAEVGRAFVEVPPFEDRPAAFLAAVRQGRFHGRLSPWSVHLASTYAKFRKRRAAG
ncbi:MAG TPA: PHP domain-containing protein [Longimicrobiales bacterium]